MNKYIRFEFSNAITRVLYLFSLLIISVTILSFVFSAIYC